jgi:hypothetical protein
MPKLTNALKTSALGGLLVIAAIVANTQPARAGDDEYSRVYCDDSGYHCYRVQRNYEDDHYRNRDYRGDAPYYDNSGYDDDYYGDRGWHYVCDSDGDRCYSSTGPYWNFREYYRRHGYHWDD